MRTRNRRGLGMMAALALLAAPVLAQEEEGAAAAGPVANGTAFGDWRVACQAVAVGRTVCVLAQRIVARETGALVGEVTLRPAQGPEGAEALLMTLTVPTGLALRARPAYRIPPAEEERALDWETCGPRLCRAVRALGAEEVGALRAATSARVGYRPLRAEGPVVFDLSLRGVTAGLAALGR